MNIHLSICRANNLSRALEQTVKPRFARAKVGPQSSQVSKMAFSTRIKPHSTCTVLISCLVPVEFVGKERK